MTPMTYVFVYVGGALLTLGFLIYIGRKDPSVFGIADKGGMCAFGAIFWPIFWGACLVWAIAEFSEWMINR